MPVTTSATSGHGPNNSSRTSRLRITAWLLLFQLVAHAPHGLDDLRMLAGLVLQLVPQPFDIHRQRVVVDKVTGHIPDIFQQLPPGEHLAWVIQKGQQQPVFQRCQQYLFPAVSRPAPRWVLTRQVTQLELADG